MLAAVLTLLVVSLAWPLGAMWLERAGRGAAPALEFDAIVVLGCRVLPDGSASTGLARRVALAAELHRRGVAPKVVLSGGKVRGPITEARAALPLLVAAGVPESAVVMEEQSRSTIENARFTHALLGDARVLIVSHAYHAPRARILFRRVFREVESAGASSPIALGGALREVPLYVLTKLRAL